ncbi:MAG: EAL domain-containing protein [Candidatus Limnocylindrales bacterium]
MKRRGTDPHRAVARLRLDSSTPETPDPWIAIEDAARYLAIPTRTLYRLAQRQEVPAVKVGRTWRFKRSVLDAHLVGQVPNGRRESTRATASPGRSDVAAPPRSDHDAEATLIALADLSVELAGLADPYAIARHLSARLRSIFAVDMAGLMQLEGGELVTIMADDPLQLPAGTGFRLEDTPLLGEAMAADGPLVIDESSLSTAKRDDVVRRLGLRSAVFVPVRTGAQTWGLLTLAAREPRRYAPEELDRLRAVASQTGLALNNARLFAETRRWSEQLERIEALSRQLSRSRAVEDVAEAVASQIESVIDWQGLRFYLLAPDGQTLEPIKLASKVDHYAHEVPDLVRLRLGEGLGGNVALAGVAEIVNDVAHDLRTRQIPGTAAIDESMIVVPFRYEETVLGVMELFRLGRDAFDATDLRIAQIVGAQASVALFNARQLEELQRGRSTLERRLASQRQLLAITERLLLHRERDTVFEAIADTLAEVVPHDTLTIYLVDRAAGCLIPVLARDEYAEQILATRPSMETGITGDVIARGEAEFVNDAIHDPRVAYVPGTPVDQKESLIVAPIRSPEGIIGALNLYRTVADFDAEDLELVRLFTNHVAIALENAAIDGRLIEAAVTDPLTGLPNRRLFSERVDHALLRRERTPTGVAVLFLDLDAFKVVNDSLGHAVGDSVLQAVAARLRACTRAGDTVARLGGDEFGILLEDVHSEAEAIVASERVIATLVPPLAVAGREVSVRASMGVALDRGQTGVTAVELLRDADTAMYQAKANGRGRFEVFEPGMHARQLARLELEGELRHGMAHGEFALAYQPIVALTTGRVVAAEALLRWHHPGRAISPAEFIGVAEETGDIVRLGAWVLREACRQTRRWQIEQPGLGNFGISVNTSARELVESTFVAAVETALAESGLAPDGLTLEITESVMLADETTAIATLRRLRDTGIHVVVDDFGTGYSSLSYLKRLPADGLKIDRSFTEGLGTGLEKTAIVRATLSFARALGLVVTAEGVETEDQLRRLLALRCDLAQGYHFSVPLEPAAMTELLASSPLYRVPRRRSAMRPQEAA